MADGLPDPAGASRGKECSTPLPASLLRRERILLSPPALDVGTGYTYAAHYRSHRAAWAHEATHVFHDTEHRYAHPLAEGELLPSEESTKIEFSVLQLKARNIRCSELCTRHKPDLFLHHGQGDFLRSSDDNGPVGSAALQCSDDREMLVRGSGWCICSYSKYDRRQ